MDLTLAHAIWDMMGMGTVAQVSVIANASYQVIQLSSINVCLSIAFDTAFTMFFDNYQLFLKSEIDPESRLKMIIYT